MSFIQNKTIFVFRMEEFIDERIFLIDERIFFVDKRDSYCCL